jgi:peptidyl-prolyl cis-trans isomerase D
MLTAIREGSKGWISGIIIGLIVLTFALWGINSYLEGENEVPVVTVNGDEIDLYTFQNELSRQRQVLTSRFGSSISPEMMESLGIRQRVIDNLIDTRLLSQYTRDQNYRLSDEQLARRIRESEIFLTDGRYDQELYQRVLAANGMSPQGYEAAERQSGLNQQLAGAIADSAFVVDSEVERLLRLQNQSREVQYALIPADLYVDDFEVTEEEARAQYDSNIEQYHNPARIRVEYIDLNVDGIAAEITPSEEEIVQTYERIKGRLRTAGVRRASHILIEAPGDADEATRADALAEAESVIAEIRGGTDFAELAGTHSDDPGSAAKGGDLGVINRGQMVQPFEDAVFDMTAGELRGPVETQFGYHIIQLTELQPEQQQSLEDARDEVIADARKAAAEARFSDLVETFESVIFEQDDSLVPAADETGLQVMTSDWFTREEGSGLAEEEAVRAAAFSEDVLQDELNSPAIELGFDRMVALRKLEYEPSAPRPFEEVREEIIAALKLERSREKVAQTAEESIEGLTHLASWDIMLAKNEWQVEQLAQRRQEVLPRLAPLADSVFSEPVPQDGQPVYGHAVLASGDAAVYALSGVTPGEPSEIDDSTRNRLEQQLTGRDGAELYRDFLALLRESAEIVIHEEQL